MKDPRNKDLLASILKQTVGAATSQTGAELIEPLLAVVKARDDERRADEQAEPAMMTTHERDVAEERCGEAEKYGFEAVEAIDTLGGANGGTGGPNYAKWTVTEIQGITWSPWIQAYSKRAHWVRPRSLYRLDYFRCRRAARAPATIRTVALLATTPRTHHPGGPPQNLRASTRRRTPTR